MSSPSLRYKASSQGWGLGRGDDLKSFDKKLLEKYRNLDCERIIPIVCDYFKEDTTFRPTKNDNTRRWNIKVLDKELEILTTGPKWFDVRSQKGGGGAIDLIMHLMESDFVSAVKLLNKIIPKTI